METTSDWSTGEDRILAIWETVKDRLHTEALQDTLLQQLGFGDQPDEVVRSVRTATRWQLELWLERSANPEGLERVRAGCAGETRAHEDKREKTTAARLREEALQEMLLKQLEIRFGDLPDEDVERVRAAEEAQLMDWVRRLVRARTLDQVLSE